MEPGGSRSSRSSGSSSHSHSCSSHSHIHSGGGGGGGGDDDQGTGGALRYQAPKDPSRTKAAKPPAGTGEFVAAKSFSGAKEGYSFKTGPQGPAESKPRPFQLCQQKTIGDRTKLASLTSPDRQGAPFGQVATKPKRVGVSYEYIIWRF